LVGPQDIERKASQFGKDMGIDSNAGPVFAQAHITYVMVPIFDTPMI